MRFPACFPITLLLVAGLPLMAQDSGEKKAKPKATPDKTRPEVRKLPAPAEASLRPGYRISYGDVIDIMVWKEPDASVSGVTIRGDGKINLPFLKEVQAAGLTPTELETRLREDLAKFIQDAEVTVLVRSVVSEKIYIMGQVRKPGPMLMTTPLNVFQALAEAGGPTEYAKKKKIYILRGGKKIPFDYNAVLKGEAMEQNIQLFPGDTIVVP